MKPISHLGRRSHPPHPTHSTWVRAYFPGKPSSTPPPLSLKTGPQLWRLRGAVVGTPQPSPPLQSVHVCMSLNKREENLSPCPPPQPACWWRWADILAHDMLHDGCTPTCTHTCAQRLFPTRSGLSACLHHLPAYLF